jgi:hypothetical protein
VSRTEGRATGYEYRVPLLGTVAVIALILVLWLLGAIAVGLAVGRLVEASRGPGRSVRRREFGPAA